MAEGAEEGRVSTISLDRLPPDVASHPPLVTTVDDRFGTAGMWLFILTEAALFVLLFFSYFYLAQGGWNWPLEKPPSLGLAIAMMVVFWISSGVLYWGQRQVRALRFGAGKTALAITIVLGLALLVLNSFDYLNHLKVLTPQTDAYGSVFYTIEGFHSAHLILGVLMLIYVLVLPQIGPGDRPPHRSYHNAAIYWHFVNVVWIFMTVFMYIVPNVR